MKCDVLTLFPDIISAYLNESILKRAGEKGLLDVKLCNFREFTTDAHNTVDDYPYGGGAGMVLKPEPIFRAIDSLRQDGEPRRVVLMGPKGKTFSQKMAEDYSEETRRFVFICGRYEGIDERVREIVDEEVSIGDYVLTGGELAALTVIDAVTRLIPGVLGDEKSIENESFSWGVLDYPHYTRPGDFEGRRVPQVLLSGDHAKIELWRRKEALRSTLINRPDLLDNIELTAQDKKLLAELDSENGT